VHGSQAINGVPRGGEKCVICEFAIRGPQRKAWYTIIVHNDCATANLKFGTTDACVRYHCAELSRQVVLGRWVFLESSPAEFFHGLILDVPKTGKSVKKF
jgi:hypothetical protein